MWSSCSAVFEIWYNMTMLIRFGGLGNIHNIKALHISSKGKAKVCEDQVFLGSNVVLGLSESFAVEGWSSYKP